MYYAFSEVHWFIFEAYVTLYTCTTENTLKFNLSFPRFDIIFLKCSYFVHAFVSTGNSNGGQGGPWFPADSYNNLRDLYSIDWRYWFNQDTR